MATWDSFFKIMMKELKYVKNSLQLLWVYYGMYYLMLQFKVILLVATQTKHRKP